MHTAHQRNTATGAALSLERARWVAARGIIISLVETEQRSDTGLIIQIALSTLEPRQPQLGVADEVR